MTFQFYILQGQSSRLLRVEFRILEILEFELATLTPAARIEIFSR